MACTVTFAYTVTNPGAGNAALQIDATNAPLFCELEFFIDTTSVTLGGTTFFPADGLHGGPPNVNFFSAWRVSITVAGLTTFPQAGDAYCLSFNATGGNVDTCPVLAVSSMAGNTPTMDLTGTGMDYTLSTVAFAVSSPSFATENAGGRTNNPIVLITAAQVTPLWELQRFDIKTTREERK